METMQIQVAGMDCSSCALSITKCLQKQGMQNVKVNYVTGDVSFENAINLPLQNISKEINSLGYTVVEENHSHHHEYEEATGFLQNNWHRFLFCAAFAAPLFLSHLVHIHWLMQPLVQLAFTLPVYVLGMFYFGKSAWRSLIKLMPNMNVLIALGSSAAFFYSLYILLTQQQHELLFFETTATTLTLVFLGNALEERTTEQTQTALKTLLKSQKVKATMIAFDDKYQEQTFTVDSKDLKVGDLILIKTGEQVPADCKILWGEGNVSESIVTGESLPVIKTQKDHLIGGSIVEDGTFKAQVTAAGKDSVLSQIIKMIQQAQTEKPPMQLLADKISAVFVPVVIAIAVLTVVVNYFFFSVSFTDSLIRSVAVLVIACPCAMGLATPAAVAVGLGRAGKKGVLFKDSKSLELFRTIKQVVFDKTGTLTIGNFKIVDYGIGNRESGNNLTKFQSTLNTKHQTNEGELKLIAYSLEKYSTHPIAKAISKEWQQTNDIRWAKIEEVKGLGMLATDKEGNSYAATSYKHVQHLTDDNTHNVYISKNNTLLGYIDVSDAIRPEAKDVINWFKQHNIKTILLSGDSKLKCEAVAKALNIDEVYAEQTPENKISFIAKLNATAPTAMVGDGINDAPALAKASIGISLSEASQLAIQSAQVVLMKNGLQNLPFAMGIGKHTYITIQQNLFWALIYNVIAIPVAAVGLLGVYGPTYGAIIMGLSDVVLAINSIRLRWKRVE